jgi:hypothetical protein
MGSVLSHVSIENVMRRTNATCVSQDTYVSVREFSFELLLDLDVLEINSASDVVKETISEFERYGAWCY